MAEDRPRDQFEVEQFELQLELEEQSVEQMRDAGARLRDGSVPRQRRMDFSLLVLVALRRSPVLTAEEQDARFEAWCDGLDIPLDDMYREVATFLARG